MSTLLIVSCKKRQQTKAVIFERKHLGDNKLQIKYRYNVADALYTDSITIENQVLKSDSIAISFMTKNPSETFVELKK